MKKNIFFIITFLFIFSTAYCVDIVNKSYREQFSTETLNEDFYRHQMRTSNFYDRQTSSVNGLVESFRETSHYSYDLFTGKFIIGSKGVLDAQAFIYDSSIASLSYILSGQYKKAENLFRIFQKEFFMSKGDNIGLCNVYRTDMQRTRWGLRPGIDGNRVHLGPNMWIAIAVLQYTAITGKTDFLPFVLYMAKWAKEIKHYSFSDGEKGGPSMGYGWQPPDWSTVYSTENVVDYYAVLKMLKYIYKHSNKNVVSIFDRVGYGLKDIDEEMANIERWLTQLILDRNKGTFNMGYNSHGIDKTDALDTISWAIPAVTPKRLDELGIDPYDMMQFADDNYLVTDTIDDVEIKGYDFTNQQGRRKNYRMIWFEGTGFHTTALQAMSKYAKKMGRVDLSEKYREQAIETLANIEKASNTLDLIDKSLPYTSKRPKDKQIYTTFANEWEIPRGKNGAWVSSSSSTGWYLIAASAFNPFDFDTENINYKLFNN